MSWASGRQIQYLGGLILFIGIVLFIIFYPVIFKAPTCFDGKQNGTETGVDCGGVCDRLCSSQTSEPVILWSRAFPVSGSTYNLLAYVENQNKNGAILDISYEFRVYDNNGLLIGRRLGSTFIPPNQRFAIFESRFDAGSSIIKSVTFDFTSPFLWVKKDPTIQTLPITIDQVILGADTLNPSLSARIVNNSVYDLPIFDTIAILYNVDHNAISVSKTYKDGLASNTSIPIFFTWPNPFTEVPVTKDVLLQVNPFLTSF